MINNRLHTPDGLMDYLPDDYDLKRSVELAAEGVFRRYGYRAVQSPTFEYIEVFEGCGVTPAQMYKFTSQGGDLLALKPDMTAAIARLAATRMSAEPEPLRLSYVANTYRDCESFHGKLREITQAGAEIIGEGGDEAAAELIAMSVKSLQEAGLEDFRLDIGSAAFLDALLGELNFSDKSRDNLRACIARHDFVAAKLIIERADSCEGIKGLAAGLHLLDPKNAPKIARGLISSKAANAALDQLERIKTLLEPYGVWDHIGYDLSMVGQLKYYTSLIWSAYAQGAATAVLAGGRYDGLLEAFGADSPAAGFAIKVNAVYSALKATQPDKTAPRPVLVAYDDGLFAQAIIEAEKLREAKQDAELCMVSGLEKCREIAEAKGYISILYVTCDGAAYI